MPLGSIANGPDSAHKETCLTSSTFATLGLSESLLRALEGASYHTPTPSQAQAIPPLLQGRDLLGVAQTGTGKTAAFVLPMLQKLAENRRHPLPRSARSLILAPTRELAIQISDSIATYGKHSGLRHAVIMGGVSQGAQVRALARGLDILVATPGRLLDLVEQRQVDLGRAGLLVLDEADRMLDMGFIRDVRKLIALLPKARQSMLFSATMPPDVAKLAGDMLRDPIRVEIAAKSVAVDRIEQQVMHADGGAKRKLLADLLADRALSRVIVFTRTKRGADRVAKQLAASGLRVAAIHGDKSQGAREKALDGFRDGRTRVLVATDIVARGIDVDGVSHVINYDLPRDAESYVHRIGRTARAGASGVAISLCDSSERSHLQDIERLIKRRLTVVGDAPRGAGRDAAKPVNLHRPNSRPAQSRPVEAAGNGRQGRRRRRRAA
jgi:ATP-dependent RNA helicase RhlE